VVAAPASHQGNPSRRRLIIIGVGKIASIIAFCPCNVVYLISQGTTEPERNVKKSSKSRQHRHHSPMKRYFPSHAIAWKRTELRVVGMVFGGASEKPGNIAAIILTVCLMVHVLETIFPSAALSHTADASLRGLATLALGYLFGRRN
jgi:hypothetical protein